ncbi:hypothetical protein CKSOR_00548 [Candidatus Kinetoplastibacterium sorsogonicusi]|uniref:DUF721 domain-containing protein n=1 Tax=Candidatus Kinetoplastidibacterium kentomonadis TaxID=1576550 RepID=A0A3Q8ERW1_9PROT|nr:DciA family protein [Candidatus Kinetoplastibacterium sorsogonicusi]AWD32654.1 hypothetical protein CKSOR_00548 [Candidatus Kinetoplastibacterium sorsogonicusi]
MIEEYTSKLEADTNMPTSLISSIKNNNIIEVANFYINLQNIIRNILPNNIAKYCYIGYIENNEIIIKVPNSAYASKIRQLSPSIIYHLKKINFQTNNSLPISIIIKIQNDLVNLEYKKINKSIPTLSKKDISNFEKLVFHIKDIKLKNAINTLIKNHQILS